MQTKATSGYCLSNILATVKRSILKTAVSKQWVNAGYTKNENLRLHSEYAVNYLAPISHGELFAISPFDAQEVIHSTTPHINQKEIQKRIINALLVLYEAKKDW